MNRKERYSSAGEKNGSSDKQGNETRCVGRAVSSPVRSYNVPFMGEMYPA